MDARLLKSYQKIIPNFVIKEDGLTRKELEMIFLEHDKDLNFSNKEHFKKLFDGIDVMYPSVYGYLRKRLGRFKASLTNNNKYKSKFSKEYWLVRGWAGSDVERLVIAAKNDHSKKFLKKSDETRKERILTLLDRYIGNLCPENDKLYEDFISYFDETWGSDKIPTRIVIVEWYQKYIKVPIKTILNKRYWEVRGWDEKTAETKIKEIQRVRSKRCIEYWLKKTDGNEREARKLLRDFQKSINRKKVINFNFSKESNEFFDAIVKQIPNHKVLYGLNEKGLMTKRGKRWYDFTDETAKVVIEYNGTYWHSTPQRKEIDRVKKEAAENLGYKLYYVWDYEYKADKLGMVDKIVKILLKEEENHEN